MMSLLNHSAFYSVLWMTCVLLAPGQLNAALLDVDLDARTLTFSIDTFSESSFIETNESLVNPDGLAYELDAFPNNNGDSFRIDRNISGSSGVIESADAFEFTDFDFTVPDSFGALQQVTGQSTARGGGENLGQSIALRLEGANDPLFFHFYVAQGVPQNLGFITYEVDQLSQIGWAGSFLFSPGEALSLTLQSSNVNTIAASNNYTPENPLTPAFELNDLQITLHFGEVIPEPNTFVLGFVVACLLLLRRCNRRGIHVEERAGA